MSACPRCGATLPGERLGLCPRCLLLGGGEEELVAGRFELLGELGRGGMATVYRARDARDPAREVALKLLDDELARDEGFLARFEREARALAMLDHERVVRILDHGNEPGLAWIAMELVEQGSLAGRLPLERAGALRAVLHVLRALEYAHSRGIVHRDIKPENLLVRADGSVLVTDFGIARVAGRRGSGWTVTGTGASAGTPHYMAPEALEGADPDPRMDLYSVGVVMYEALTGRLPVGDFAPLAGGLDGVVRRALAPDPARRFQSASEMAAEVERALDREGADDLPPEERTFLNAVAAVHTVAGGVALWALLESITPKVLPREDVGPLVLFATEELADGRVVTRARFETWPAFAAIFAFAVAAAVQGVLSAHWRRGGLLRPSAEGELPGVRAVLVAGWLSVGLYGLKVALAAAGWNRVTSYVPVLGGLLLVFAFFLWWRVVIEGWRLGRKVPAERRFWVATGLILGPPAAELLGFLLAWEPA